MHVFAISSLNLYAQLHLESQMAEIRSKGAQLGKGNINSCTTIPMKWRVGISKDGPAVKKLLRLHFCLKGFAMCRSFLFLDGTDSVSGWNAMPFHQQWWSGNLSRWPAEYFSVSGNLSIEHVEKLDFHNCFHLICYSFIYHHATNFAFENENLQNNDKKICFQLFIPVNISLTFCELKYQKKGYNINGIII